MGIKLACHCEECGDEATPSIDVENYRNKMEKYNFIKRQRDCFASLAMTIIWIIYIHS